MLTLFLSIRTGEPAGVQAPQTSQASEATCGEMVKRIDRMDLEAGFLAKD